jgi:hypothetical protein
MKKLVHWLIAIAVVLHLIALIFLGQSYLPNPGF